MTISAEIQTAIDEQTQGINVEDVEELIFSNIKISTITLELKAKLESYENLASLAFNNCNLESLHDFPRLGQLLRLELIGNNLSGKDLNNIGFLTQIQSLSLGGNAIECLEDIQVLTKFEQLFQLDLSGTEFARSESYRKDVFTLLPWLNILDNCDANGLEINYSDDEDLDSNEEGEDDSDDAQDNDDDNAEGSDGESQDDEEYEGDDSEEIAKKGKKSAKRISKE